MLADAAAEAREAMACAPSSLIGARGLQGLVISVRPGVNMAAHSAGHPRHSPLSGIASFAAAQAGASVPSAVVAPPLPSGDLKLGGRRRLDGWQHSPSMRFTSEAMHLFVAELV